ncbi:MAG: hypothetical protein ACTSRU_11780 [Candidatus Hodarchaeales archaeon]
MKRNQNELFRSKTLYIGAIFITFFFLLLHGISREFHGSGSLYLGNQFLEFLAVITIYCCTFTTFAGIYSFYIRNEKNPKRRRNLKLILFLFIILIVFNFMYNFATEKAAEDNNDTTTTTTSPASSSVSSSQSSQVSNSPSESTNEYSGIGTATTAPEQPTLLDPRLIIVVVGLLFTGMYFLRKTALSGDKSTDKELGINNEIPEVELNRRERIKKNYIESSTELEIFGADSSPVLTTREFQKGVAERFKRRSTIDPNITELTEVYELVKFSNQTITEEHAIKSEEAKKAINKALFPVEDDNDKEQASKKKYPVKKAEDDRR